MGHSRVLRYLVWFAASVAVALITGCGATSVSPVLSTTVDRQLRANSTTLDFGSTTVGTTSAMTCTLTASGNSVTISQLTVTGSGFSVSGFALPTVLSTGQSATITVNFDPQVAGSVSGALSIASNAANSPNTVSLTAVANAPGSPVLSLNPTSVSFGSVVLGSSSSRSVAISNTGNASLTLSQLNVSGSGYSAGGLALPLSLAAGASTSFTLTFAPAAATGTYNGTVSFVTNALNSPTTMALTGTGAAAPVAQLTPNPTSVGFGSVTVGSSGTQSISVSNTGNANLTISQITTSGAGFSGSGITVPLTLTPGQSASYTTQFAPTTTGSASGQISFVSNASNSPTSVTLSGSGVAAPVVQVSANPTSVSFGSVIIGSSGTQSVTVSNTGNASVTITQITTSGTGFSGSGIALPLTLTPGQSANYTAKFNPTVAGSATGQISFVSNASNSPTLVSLTGTGVAQVLQLTANPTSLAFGNVSTGSSVTKSMAVTNTGNVNVTISQVNTTGAGFAVTGSTVPLTLTPGQSVTYVTQFAPASAGSVTGQLSIVSNASNSPTAVSLSGTGVAPTTSLSATPTSLAFGNVAVGSTSSMSGKLTASGGSVTISAATVAGSEYVISGMSLPVTLSAGQSATFSIAFAPTASGSATGSVAFTSTASNSPTVSLSGTGTTTTTPCGQLDDGVSADLPVNYTSLAPPAKGQSYIDPVFGCTITRLTDGRTDLGKAVYHEYASMTPINADDSMVALLDFNANWYIVDMQGNILISPSALPWQGGTGWRWSTTVRNVMYGVPNMSAAGCTASANTLGKIVISGSSVSCSVLHTFTEYTSISLGGGEGDISDDGDHIAVQGKLANGTAEIFVYTISTNSKGGVFNYGTNAFDNAQITHSNRVVINWGTENNINCSTPGVPCYNGFELFSSNMTYIRQVFRNGVHSKELVDLAGNEVVAIADSGSWFCPQGQGIAVIDLNTSAGKCVLNNLPWNASIHVGASTNGWIVSEHLDYGSNSTASYPLASNWQSLWTHGDNEIFLIRVDGSQTRRLIHHRSFGAGDYWKIPRPSISRDGKWVIFDSDFGLGNPVSDYADVYLIAVQ